MKRLGILIALVSTALLGGCGDYHARQLLTQNTGMGKITTALMAPNDRLLQQKRISAYASITTSDKTLIDVWVIGAREASGTRPASKPAAGEGKATIVILHGLNESKAAFPYFGTAQRLADKGYDVVLADLRAHGRSGGEYITFGAKEKHDLAAVMDELVRRRLVSERVYLLGANLGAAVAVQYAAINPRVKGVLAMAPYQDFRTIARWQVSLNPLVYQIMTDEQFDTTVRHACEMGQFQLADTSTLSAVTAMSGRPKDQRPALVFVHGLLDLQAPMEQTEALFRAYQGPKKMIVITPGPEQAGLVFVLENWLADQMAKIATGHYDDTGVSNHPATQASQPASAKATQP